MSKPGEFTPNPKQHDAIAHGHGPMLVVAGAGTGKTTVLTRRIARLIAEGIARPDEILAITFTRNAAAEIREKVRRAVGEQDISGLHTGTFHSYCYGLLKRHGQSFRVLDKPDLWIYLRRRLRDLPLARFIRAASPARFLHDLLEFFERCNDELVDAAGYAAYVRKVEANELPLPQFGKEELEREEVLARCREIRDVFATVEAMLEKDGLGTFGAIITRTLALLQEDAVLLAAERAHARFILIDEFQDSNSAQIELARLLGGDEQNMFAVGDPDQAIYRFRGASEAAFEAFLAAFRGVHAVYLDENQRSTSHILACAHAAIAQNPEIVRAQHDGLELRRKPLQSAREERAQRVGIPILPQEVDILLSRNAADEGRSLAAALRGAQRAGATWSECAVLYRKHVHRERVTLALDELGIPYQVEGVDVLDVTPVRDLLAVLRAIDWPNDAVSLLRVAALPQFTIDPAELRSAFAAAARGTAVADIVGTVAGGSEVIRQLEAARAFAHEQELRLAAVMTYAVSRFAIDTSLKPVRTFIEFAQVWLRNPITRTGKLPEFLDYLEMFKQAGGAISDKSSVEELEADAGGQIMLAEAEHEDAVRLMTVHAAKGLEFQHVHVIRASSSTFPTGYERPLFDFPRELRRMPSGSAFDEKSVHKQEELRLFYVAMTRACDTLSLWANRARGKRPDDPPDFLRPLKKRAPAGAWRQRFVEPEITIEAGAATPITPMPPRMQAWLALPPRPEGVAELSASAIDAYERCPLQFKIQRDWRLPAEPGAALLFGSAMHDVLHSYFEGRRQGKNLGVDELVAPFDAVLADKTFDDAYQRELYRQQGEDQLRRFWQQQQEQPAREVLGTERGFKVEIGGLRVTGRVDLLERIAGDRVRVVDYKTGAPKEQKDADDSLQLSLYALAVERAWGLMPEVLVFYNLENATAVETRRTREALHDVETKVKEVAERIAAEEFQPKTGQHCGWCAYRTLCPATEQRLFTIQKAGAGVN